MTRFEMVKEMQEMMDRMNTMAENLSKMGKEADDEYHAICSAYSATRYTMIKVNNKRKAGEA